MDVARLPAALSAHREVGPGPVGAREATVSWGAGHLGGPRQ